MIWAIAITAPWLIASALFFAIGTPIWPGLLVSCLIAGIKDWRPAVALACAVLVMQAIKHTYPQEHLWVYYGSVYAILGVYFALFWGRVLAGLSIVIMFLYLSRYFAMPMAIIDIGTELAFMVALIAAVLNGPSGGILGRLRGPSRSHANGGSLAFAARHNPIGDSGDSRTGVLRLARKNRVGVDRPHISQNSA